MATFVLVHGAWGGSWVWVRLARILRAAGHDVFTPSLTGLGERSHLLSPGVDLSTHVTDVLNVLRYERLSEIVLVGHSYGGMVVTAAADAAAERVRALVYLDAFVPNNGDSLLGLLPTEARAAMLASAEREGEGWKVPPLPPERMGMTDPEEIAWIKPLRGPQPLRSFTQPVALRGRHLGVAKRVYVFATGYRPSNFARFADAARADPAWAYCELPTHHSPQISMPRETAELLLRHT